MGKVIIREDVNLKESCLRKHSFGRFAEVMNSLSNPMITMGHYSRDRDSPYHTGHEMGVWNYDGVTVVYHSHRYGMDKTEVKGRLFLIKKKEINSGVDMVHVEVILGGSDEDVSRAEKTILEKIASSEEDFRRTSLLAS